MQHVLENIRPHRNPTQKMIGLTGSSPAQFDFGIQISQKLAGTSRKATMPPLVGVENMTQRVAIEHVAPLSKLPLAHKFSLARVDRLPIPIQQVSARFLQR